MGTCVNDPKNLIDDCYSVLIATHYGSFYTIPFSFHIGFASCLQENAQIPGGEGVTTIYAGTGCAIIWGAFFRAENKFWGIIFGKSQVVINFVVSF